MNLTLTFLLMLFPWLAVTADEVMPDIQTNSGQIRGSIIKIPGGSVIWQFLGVPYAEPPLGLLRFKSPLPVKTWSGVRNATQFSDACMQIRASLVPQKINVSEDCLYLNIWVPKSTNANAQPLPVMVWIHGGGFKAGTSSGSNGAILALRENVIVVAMNYRLSIFGFIYAGVPDAPGNAGLLDQLEALKWTKNNIGMFGGNPESITIFGESAGGISVGHHVMSPLSRPYFNRAIMQSGTANMAVGENNALKSMLAKVAAEFQCISTGVNPIQLKPEEWTAIVQCLRNKPAIALANSDKNTVGEVVTWAPVVEDYFLPENPVTALKKGSFNSVDILIGSVTNEMAIFLYIWYPTIFNIYKKIDLSVETFKLLFPAMMLVPGHRKNPAIVASTRFEYAALAIENKDNSSVLASILEQMSGDSFFTCPIEFFAQQAANFGRNVYRYLFTYENPAVSVNHPLLSCIHGSDVVFTFGLPTIQVPKNQVQAALSETMMRFWANFARTGNPNLNTDSSTTSIIWPKYSENQAYIELDGKLYAKHTGGYRKKKCLFWNQLVPDMQNLTNTCFQ